MAKIIYILLVVVGVTVPYVENAPSGVMNTANNDELHKRLVFIDKNTADAINSNSQILLDAISPTETHQTQKTSLARSRLLEKSAMVQTGSSLESNAQGQTSSQLVMDDDRQIWGIAVEKHDTVEDETYYSRPLSLPKTLVKTPSEINNHVTRVTETLRVNNVPKPSACDLAILSCCGTGLNLKECFKSRGCESDSGMSFTEDIFSSLCSSDSIDRVVKVFGKYYKNYQ